jgi:hypothetical protein
LGCRKHRRGAGKASPEGHRRALTRKTVATQTLVSFQSQHGQAKTLFHPNSKFRPLPSNLPVIV